MANLCTILHTVDELIVREKRDHCCEERITSWELLLSPEEHWSRNNVD